MLPENSMVEWVDVIIRLVTMGGFGALVWYLVVRHMPSVDARHLEERNLMDERHRAERDEWRQFIANRDEALKAVISEFTKSLTDVKMEIVRGKSRRSSDSSSY